MSRVIDVSSLPVPQVLDTSYSTIKAERLAALEARYRKLGLPWDVAAIEADPGVILQSSDAYREVLDRAAINASVRRVLPAFAAGADLDAIAARANVDRLEVSPASPDGRVAAVRENDAALLDRYLRGFSAPAAGSADGYIFRAASAWPGRYDIAAVNGGAGKVLIYLLGSDGIEVPIETVLKVALALQAKDAKGLTDDVSVRAARVARYRVGLRIQVPRGPDPSIVVELAEASVRAFALSRYAIGAEVPANAVAAAAYVPNVSRVIPSQALVDIAAVEGVAPWLQSLTITPEIIG